MFSSGALVFFPFKVLLLGTRSTNRFHLWHRHCGLFYRLSRCLCLNRLLLHWGRLLPKLWLSLLEWWLLCQVLHRFKLLFAKLCSNILSSLLRSLLSGEHHIFLRRLLLHRHHVLLGLLLHLRLGYSGLFSQLFFLL